MSKQTERDAFRSRWGFILACIGSAVGMGNIWRFPYLVSAWGGMTFLLPYFLFVLLIGSTGIIGEMALGRFTRSGPIGAFGQAAALRGRRSTGEAVGYIPVLGSLALAIGYSCVVGWIFKYFALALDGGCVDAQVLLALATKTDDAMLDAVGAAMADGGATGPDADELARWDDPFARPRIRATEVMSRLLLQTGRIGAARDLCGRLVDADPSDPTGARYTLALAHARMEDEDALDALDARYARRGNAWFHLARTLLLFKLDRAASAGRALDGYCSLCEGGAFALLRPTFIEAYLPDRPDFAPHGFTEATLAVHEADPLIVDAPDFANWAGARPGVTEQAMAYAKSQGLDW